MLLVWMGPDPRAQTMITAYSVLVVRTRINHHQTPETGFFPSWTPPACLWALALMSCNTKEMSGRLSVRTGLALTSSGLSRPWLVSSGPWLLKDVELISLLGPHPGLATAISRVYHLLPPTFPPSSGAALFPPLSSWLAVAVEPAVRRYEYDTSKRTKLMSRGKLP